MNEGGGILLQLLEETHKKISSQLDANRDAKASMNVLIETFKGASQRESYNHEVFEIKYICGSDVATRNEWGQTTVQVGKHKDAVADHLTISEFSARPTIWRRVH
jgi:hypothetical protein